jgi:hypothetical protein
MKWVTVVVGCVVNGVPVKPGTLVEVSDTDAAQLLAMKRVIAADPPPEVAVKPAARKATKPTTKRRTRSRKSTK